MGKPGSKASGLTRLTKSPRKPSVSQDLWPIYKVTADARPLSLLETHAHTQLRALQWLYVRMGSCDCTRKLDAVLRPMREVGAREANQSPCSFNVC